jgi:hypothetical protein
MFLALAGARWPPGLDPWLLWLLPVPVVVEWWMEHSGRWAYSATRNTVTSLLCAPPVGVGLARYVRHPADGLFWAVVITYGVVCLTPMILRRRFVAREERALRG